jgi:translocation and assembly module TamA
MRPGRLSACVFVLLLAPAVAAGRVEVEGVRGDLRDNVLAHLSVDEAGCDAPGWRVRRLNRKAEAQVREALEAYGYYDPVISIEQGSADGCWLTTIRIEPGEPVRLREVRVAVSGEAAADPAFAMLRDTSPLAPGKALRHADYERFKRAFADLARQRGYFAGRFTESRIDVYAAELVADVVLDWDSGPRYRFGPVTFEQDVVRPELVERFVDFAPGEPYDGAVIEDFYNALLGTGYFATVDLRTQPGTPPDIEVPVTVAMTAAKRRVYTVGAGYSTDAGVKVRGGYTDRRVNDRGHQFDASFSVSQILQQAGVAYRLPRKDPRVEWLSFDAGYRDSESDTNRSEIWKVGVKEFRRRRHDWIETRFIDVSTERFEVAGASQREFLLIPGVSWSRKRPETAILTRPEQGHRLTLRLSGTTELIGSDSEFLQLDGFARFIFPAWKGARVLARAEAGATVKDEFRTLPASVRYFAGGDNSVRGYDYESLGPTDENGNVIGGSHKLIGSVELDQMVWRNWSVAAFVDTGNAFDSFANLRTKTGAGAGIRWYSPLGPVRVDLAFPLDKDAPDDWRIHVTLGPDL